LRLQVETGLKLVLLNGDMQQAEAGVSSTAPLEEVASVRHAAPLAFATSCMAYAVRAAGGQLHVDIRKSKKLLEFGYLLEFG
jgi:hypothetical protein